MIPQTNGRKYTMTNRGMVLTVVPLLLVFLLAGLGKITPEIATLLAAILPPYYIAVGALVGGFNLSNAMTYGKTAPGEPTP